MEVFEVEYEGRKILVQKSERGSIYATLPPRLGDRGGVFRETITHESRGWRFTSTQDDDIEYYFHMWLKPDGRMAWANDMSHGIQEFNEPFNPYYPNAGVLNDTALQLYSIVKQIEEYQKRDIPAMELLLLRQYHLNATLKMLGYDSVEDVIKNSNNGRGYLALNRVSSQLEDYTDLSGLVISLGEISGEESFACIAPKDVDKRRALELGKPVKEQIESNVAYMQEHENGLAKRRSILPGYRTGMSDKVGVYTMDNYENAVRNTALLLLELNADLLTDEQRKELGIGEHKHLDELSLRDRISRLIDSKEFNDACKCEHEFACGQSEKLIETTKRIIDGMEPIERNSDYAKGLISLVLEETRALEARKRFVETHEDIEARFYAKKRNKRTIRDDDDEHNH